MGAQGVGGLGKGVWGREVRVVGRDTEVGEGGGWGLKGRPARATHEAAIIYESCRNLRKEFCVFCFRNEVSSVTSGGERHCFLFLISIITLTILSNVLLS